MDNHVETGLQVNADDVTVYGLNVDNTLHDLVNWNGNSGRVYSSALNLASDLDKTEYMNGTYAALKIDDNVTSHLNYGTGIYMNENSVTIHSAILAPHHTSVHFFNIYTKDESGFSTIEHGVNDDGDAAEHGGSAFLCQLDQ